MKLELLPPGGPHEHLGLSHTLKHYLRPQEMWVDICDQVDPQELPAEVAARLPTLNPAAWEQWESPPPALATVWEQLSPAYDHGYGAIILRLAEALPEPSRSAIGTDIGEASQIWIVRNRRRVCDAGRGVVLMVTWRSGGWNLYSAFRPADFKLKRHECPPSDTHSVEIRRKLADLAARKRIIHWRAQEQDR